MIILTNENWLLIFIAHSMIRSTMTCCHKAVFTAIHGSRHLGRVIQRSGQIRVDQCQRICRMYSECYGFNMKWSDMTVISGVDDVVDMSGVSGDCEVLDIGDRTENGTRGYRNETGYSYYATCPESMLYYPDVDHCYAHVTAYFMWDEAIQYCKDEFQGSHLLDLQTALEETVVQQIIGTTRIWLGARRPSNASINDIFWVHRNTSVWDGYTNWGWNNPDMNGANKKKADCIVWAIEYWADTMCDVLREIVCEY